PIKELAPDAPDGMVAVVERLMQKGPANRFASCAEAIEGLRAFGQPASVHGQRRGTMQMPRVKLPPRPAAPAPAPLAPAAPPPAVAPDLSASHPAVQAKAAQPLPPRAPSGGANQGTAYTPGGSSQGATGRPAAPKVIRPSEMGANRRPSPPAHVA